MQRTTTLSAVGAIALAAAACGSGGGGGAPTSPTSAPGGGAGSVVTIAITGQSGKLAFNPNPATVDATQKVQFKNNDAVTHHIMLDGGSAQTADIPPGATSAAISTNGSAGYHCTIHPGMVGGFNGSTGDPPPNCSYQYCAWHPPANRRPQSPSTPKAQLRERLRAATRTVVVLALPAPALF